MKTINAEFSRQGSDLYWTIWTAEDRTMTWGGYDDEFWWERVSKSDRFRLQVGGATKRIYQLDPHSNLVTVSEKP